LPIMNHAESVTAIEDLEAVAWDLSHLIPENNEDIIEEFGVGATAFTGEVDYVVSNLKRVAVYEKHDVDDPAVAEIVDVSTPNFGIWVCNPYRGIGVGRVLAAACREAIDEHFNREAWTVVQHWNAASKHTVESMGFSLRTSLAII
jgi:hypothetical protein